MSLHGVSEYNRDQWVSYRAIQAACERLSDAAKDELRGMIQPYLNFRRAIDAFQEAHFAGFCREACFESGLSACCSFESIITFFADQAINALLSTPDEMRVIFDRLERPNTSSKCVYLGAQGCLWTVRPISCATFLCQQAKEEVFGRTPEVAGLWEGFHKQEGEYTWPTQPVLFDDLEHTFINLGVNSPHMYFHRSPGLLRVKAEAGLIPGRPRRKSKG